MKARKLVLLVAIMVAGVGGISLGAGTSPVTAAPAVASGKYEQKLAIKPKLLRAIEVQGAMLVTSTALRVFLLEGTLAAHPKVDGGALYDAAKQCAAGQGCGRKLLASEVNSLYAFIEASTWFEGIVDGRLVAVVESGGSTFVFTDARAFLPDVTRLILEGRVCSPQGSGGSQPQCPPGGIPPRDEWLANIVLAGWPQ